MNHTEQKITIGNRVPKDYFVTSGTGQSDIQIHAGSYHLALKDAGIERHNIMTYSSILPAIANEIARPHGLVHGSVMETISAVAHAGTGERATAAIAYGWLYERSTGKRHGGLVCEYNGGLTEDEAQASLLMSLQELYTNGFEEDYELRDITCHKKSIILAKKHGTALVALCFTSYEVPLA